MKHSPRSRRRTPSSRWRAILRLQAHDPTASTTVRDSGEAMPATSRTRSSALALAVRASARAGSPTSARAPAGRASRWPRRCRTRTWRWSRARSGTAGTSSARSRSPGLANVHRRQRARRGVAEGLRRPRPRHGPCARGAAGDPRVRGAAARRRRARRGLEGRGVGDEAPPARPPPRSWASSAGAVAVTPYPGARDHTLHVFCKIAPTPERFPRRPGMATKRPLQSAFHVKRLAGGMGQAFLGLPYDWRDRPARVRDESGTAPRSSCRRRSAGATAEPARVARRQPVRSLTQRLSLRGVSRETSPQPRAVRPTAPLASGSAWAPSTRSRIRRAGSARRPPRSTWPRASPPPATRRSWSTWIRRATRPSGSASRATHGPGVYDVLAGDVEARDAVRPTGVEHLSILVSTPDLAGATMELPRLPGSETPPARRAGAAARRLRVHPARLPAVARAADRQRPGRRRARDRAGPDRVLRARGPGRAAGHAVADPARAQPAADRRRACC